MAIKKVTKVEEVEVCDLCGGKIFKGYTDKDSGKRFDTITCKNFFVFKNKEAWITYRKEAFKEQGYEEA